MSLSSKNQVSSMVSYTLSQQLCLHDSDCEESKLVCRGSLEQSTCFLNPCKPKLPGNNGKSALSLVSQRQMRYIFNDLFCDYTCKISVV